MANKIFKEIYNQKLIPSSEVKKFIKSNTNLAFSMHFMQPRKILEEIANIARSDKDFKINAYYFSAKQNAADTVLDFDLNKQIVPNTFFMQDTERKILKRQKEESLDEKRVFFIPAHFSDSPRIFSENLKIDSFVTMVSPMNEYGYMSMGLSNDYSSTVVRLAKTVIVEVNKNIPFVIGENNLIHVSDVSAIVEHDSSLQEVVDLPPTPEEETIAKIVSEFIPDRACIQMGIGGLPNSICNELYNKKDLGIHTEVLTTGMIGLIKAGVVTNKYKKINKNISVFTFAIGNKQMYEELHLNPTIQSFPVNYVNDPYVISKIDNLVSINSTIEIDLTGACNSEYLNGHQFSATGGQVDFVRGAYMSQGGKSIIALTSTTKNKKFSKIVARLSGPTTTLRNDVHWVVTEYGAVNLKGLNTAQRARALINLAHPDFREDLEKQAKELNLL